jgi:hypothetical protein
MVLKAFTEYTQPPLEVQYEPGGKVYRIPPVTIEGGAIIRAQAADPAGFLDQHAGKPEDWLYRLILGPVWDEMVADGVPEVFAVRVYLTALTDHLNGRDAAEKIFAEGIDPKVVAVLLETQRKAPPKVSARSTRTGAATTTRSRARGSGTTKPRT